MPSAGDRMLPGPLMYVLLSLADEERHGYGIMRDIERRTDGAVVLGPATLYTTIQRALSAGYIEEANPRKSDHARGRRVYRLTATGRAAAGREIARLESMLTIARHVKLRPIKEGR
jgi:DNA-binding PadR family transcriptional regulator